MRFHTLVAVFAAAGTIADTNIDITQQRRQTAASVVGWSSPALAARSSSNLHTLSTRRANLQRGRSNPSSTVSRQDEEDEDEEDDDDDDDDGDDGDEDRDDEDDNKGRRRSHTAAIAGGVVGGVILLLLLLFLLFWFKIRPRRQNRRRRRRQEKEDEEERRRSEEANANYAMDYQRPYHPVATHDPPQYREAIAVPKAPASPPPQPHGTAVFPAELPSPVDGREPSWFPSVPDSKENRVSAPRNPTSNPADEPNPTY
ncbi:hypothetical protein E0Z10_g8107 [Xylaria hypoxylon]|uniref:receptor protein-tyrosine kinase n=1 Tax=Xylaria hypoxylon TaxID=37992 RepID=A0A4Z0Y937_9PEZI|nr:hypothetical protein E0Z10_g8107 [Xylaria hypoxylon]